MADLVGARLFVQLHPRAPALLSFMAQKHLQMCGEGFLAAGGGESWAGEVVVPQVPVGIDSLFKENVYLFKKNVVSLEFP